MPGLSFVFFDGEGLSTGPGVARPSFVFTDSSRQLWSVNARGLLTRSKQEVCRWAGQEGEGVIGPCEAEDEQKPTLFLDLDAVKSLGPIFPFLSLEILLRGGLLFARFRPASLLFLALTILLIRLQIFLLFVNDTDSLLAQLGPFLGRIAQVFQFIDDIV